MITARTIWTKVTNKPASNGRSEVVLRFITTLFGTGEEIRKSPLLQGFRISTLASISEQNWTGGHPIYSETVTTAFCLVCVQRGLRPQTDEWRVVATALPATPKRRDGEWAVPDSTPNAPSIGTGHRPLATTRRVARSQTLSRSHPDRKRSRL